ERGLDDLVGEDPLGLVHGGQLEFLLGAEVGVQAAFAQAGGGGQVPDRQALQPVGGGQGRGGAQDRGAGALPVGARVPVAAGAVVGGGVRHVDKIARSVVLFNSARPIVLSLRRPRARSPSLQLTRSSSCTSPAPSTASTSAVSPGRSSTSAPTPRWRGSSS